MPAQTIVAVFISREEAADARSKLELWGISAAAMRLEVEVPDRGSATPHEPGLFDRLLGAARLKALHDAGRGRIVPIASLSIRHESTERPVIYDVLANYALLDLDEYACIGGSVSGNQPAEIPLSL